MTREQFDAKMETLYERAIKDIRKEVADIMKTGAVNLADAEDDFVLPMAVLAVELERAALQWAPSKTHYYHRAYRKLRSFFL